MKPLQVWLEQYGVSHQNKTNRLIHKICVPLIYFSSIGIFWELPFPWENQFFINWATTILIPVMIFYFSLKLLAGVFMLTLTLLNILLIFSINKLILTSSFNQVWEFALYPTVFAIAWIGQFIGHKIEGKKPSFLEDIQFLLIGPLWIFPFFHKND